MSLSPEREPRVEALEVRTEEVTADAAAARHLAAAHDRDLADLGVKVDANRKAINALGLQNAARFDRLEGRVDRIEGKVDAGFARMDAKFAQIDVNFDQVNTNFATVRARLDQAAAAFEHIGGMLTTLIERDEK
jgi:hypothetical protein